MTKKIIKTKNQKPKNKVVIKKDEPLKNAGDELRIELGLKNAIELYYKEDKDGISEIHFKGFDEPQTLDERKKVINNFYGAFGVKNALITDTLLHNTMMVSASSMVSNNERELNFAYSFLKEIKPKDTLEAMLAIQMLGTHLLSCKSINRANIPNQTPEGISENINRATKLTRTFIAQMEALKKNRSKGNQKITVEHININEGGKAVIGSTINNQVNNNSGAGGEAKDEK